MERERLGIRGILARTIGLALGAVFLYAGLSKAADGRETLRVFLHFVPGRPGVAIDLVRALVVYEVVLGALLIAGISLRTMLLASAGTFSVFSLRVAYLIAWQLELSCGCGIGASYLVSGDERIDALIRVLSFLLLSVVGVLVSRPISGEIERPADVPGF